MNIMDLQNQLNALNISHELYNLSDGFPNEAYCFHQTNAGIEIYYSERGKKRGAKFFLSENEACHYFLEKVVSYANKAQNSRKTTA